MFLQLSISSTSYIASVTKLVQRATTLSGGQRARPSHLDRPIGTEAPPLTVLAKVQLHKSRHQTGTADILHPVFVCLQRETWGQDLGQRFSVEI